MPRRSDPRIAPKITEQQIDEFTRDLGIVDDRERHRIARTIPRLIDSFYMLEQEKADRRTAPARLKDISEFQQSAKVVVDHLTTWARTAMIETELELLPKGLNPEQHAERIHALDREVKADVSSVTTGIDRLLQRVQRILNAIEEGKQVASVFPEVRKATNNRWLAKMCLNYWRRNLEQFKINQENFVFAVFQLARVNIGRERAKELLQEARHQVGR